MGTRILEADKDHAAFIAWVSLAAARSHLPRGFWDFFLDASDAECLRYLEVLAGSSRPHPFHYSTFLVAEVDGRPAAALCGFFEEEHGFREFGGVMAEVDGTLGRPPERARLRLAVMDDFMSVSPWRPHRPWIGQYKATV